jgi:hypothetical protein
VHEGCSAAKCCEKIHAVAIRSYALVRASAAIFLTASTNLLTSHSRQSA